LTTRVVEAPLQPIHRNSGWRPLPIIFRIPRQNRKNAFSDISACGKVMIESRNNAIIVNQSKKLEVKLTKSMVFTNF
jgi:hypothetical protein